MLIATLFNLRTVLNCGRAVLNIILHNICIILYIFLFCHICIKHHSMTSMSSNYYFLKLSFSNSVDAIR